MNRKQALSEYYGYNTLVLREGSVNVLSIADLIHSEDKFWRVKLILYPPSSEVCKNLEEYQNLKSSHIDIFGLIENNLAVSVNSFPTDPYAISS